MDTSGATLVVAVILGVEEVLLRVSVFWRDRKVKDILLGSCRKPTEGLRPLTRRDIELYSDLASMDIVSENCSIVCSVTMLWALGGMPIERALADLALQLIVEFAVDWVRDAPIRVLPFAL
jgi:hypothetical protein